MAQAWLDDPDHPVGDLVLQFEYVLGGAVELVGPQVRAGLRLDELSRDPQARAGFPHAPLKHVAHAKLAADLAHVDRLALVDEARIARDHEQPLDPREPGHDVVDNSVGEIVLFRVPAHVLEWQDGDRRLLGQRQLLGGRFARRRFRPGMGSRDQIGSRRPGDILEFLLAEIDEFGLDLVANLPPGVL